MEISLDSSKNNHYNKLMKILTLDNEPYDLDHLPEEIDDMRFAILDNVIRKIQTICIYH